MTTNMHGIKVNHHGVPMQAAPSEGAGTWEIVGQDYEFASEAEAVEAAEQLGLTDAVIRENRRYV